MQEQATWASGGRASQAEELTRAIVLEECEARFLWLAGWEEIRGRGSWRSGHRALGVGTSHLCLQTHSSPCSVAWEADGRDHSYLSFSFKDSRFLNLSVTSLRFLPDSDWHSLVGQDKDFRFYFEWDGNHQRFLRTCNTMWLTFWKSS